MKCCLATVTIAVALVVASPRESPSAFEGVVSVAQPMFTADAGLRIAFAAYVGYIGWGPAQRVTMTCWANATKVVGGSALGGRESDVENRNVARLAGLRIRHVPKSVFARGISADEPYFGDTLRVVLEIPPEAMEKEEAKGWEGSVFATLREVVRATIECARINAANQSPNLHYLDIQVEGMADLSATYSLEGAPSIPSRPLWFDESGTPAPEAGKRPADGGH